MQPTAKERHLSHGLSAQHETTYFAGTGAIQAIEQNTCRGSTFAARRDAAIIAVFTATGIRLSELGGIRCHPGDPTRTDLDLHAREIRIAGKGGKPRTVKIGHQTARSLDRYLRARAGTRRPGGPSYGSARAAAGRSPPPASTRSSPAAAAKAA
jgi:site-specific recombinase XerD